MNIEKRPMLVNVERLHRLMDEAGCAAIVARSGKNFTYLAGIAYPGTLARHLDFPDTPRDVFCIWPRSGEPIVVTHHAGRPITERDSWVERIEVIEDYVESGIEGAARVLRSLGLDGERIGFREDLRLRRAMERDRAGAATRGPVRLHGTDGRGAPGEDTGRGRAAAQGRRHPGRRASGGVLRDPRRRHGTSNPRPDGRGMHRARLRIRARDTEFLQQSRHVLGRRRSPVSQGRRHPHRLCVLSGRLPGPPVTPVLARSAFRRDARSLSHLPRHLPCACRLLPARAQVERGVAVRARETRRGRLPAPPGCNGGGTASVPGSTSRIPCCCGWRNVRSKKAW